MDDSHMTKLDIPLLSQCHQKPILLLMSNILSRIFLSESIQCLLSTSPLLQPYLSNRFFQVIMVQQFFLSQQWGQESRKGVYLALYSAHSTHQTYFCVLYTALYNCRWHSLPSYKYIPFISFINHKNASTPRLLSGVAPVFNRSPSCTDLVRYVGLFIDKRLTWNTIH